MHFCLRLSRRSMLAGLAALAANGACLRALAQQPGAAFHPVRPVKLINPLLAGGATDAIVRPIAQKLSELWGQPVVVENKAGGGTIVGTLAVAQAAPDGHTFGVCISALTINPSLRGDLPYDTFRDLTPITQIGTVTSVLVAHPSLPANNLQEFIQLAKAKPGTISWASLGVGTAGHITGELLRKRAAIEIVHVPFSGSAGAYRELLPGRVQVAFVVLESALPHLKAGKLKLLAVADLHRNKQFPQVQVLDDTIKGLSYEGIFGLIGPAGIAPETLKALQSDIARVLADREIRQQLDRQSMDVVASSPAEFAAAIRREVDHWKQAVKESGANVN
ncbi:MAG TPA: tripartite tricarboxylate transporter substrate binding protein [Ramlibacter sp.]|nr:tripartite tricarboxylate transporter substrate binding protein [Ramlibacter sp.]